MKKCSICGKEYKLNKNILHNLPPHLKEHLKFIPSCECLTKAADLELKNLEREQIEESKDNRIKKYKDISIVDKKFLRSTFKNADMSPKHMQLSRAYTNKFIKTQGFEDYDEDIKGLLFYGGVGVGKTYATACIANELLNDNYRVVAMQLGKYLLEIKKAFRDKESDAADVELELLKLVEECDLLIVDDFGTETVTPFAKEVALRLIDCRYRTIKPLIISTNLNPEQLRQAFGNRIADRINGMTADLKITGESRRGKDKIESLVKLLA